MAAEEAEHEAEATYARVRSILIGLIGLAFLIGIGVALWIARSIVSGIRRPRRPR